MLTIGMSTCGNKPLTDESFREMVAAGIGALEISQGDYDSFDIEDLTDAMMSNMPFEDA